MYVADNLGESDDEEELLSVPIIKKREVRTESNPPSSKRNLYLCCLAAVIIAYAIFQTSGGIPWWQTEEVNVVNEIPFEDPTIEPSFVDGILCGSHTGEANSVNDIPSLNSDSKRMVWDYVPDQCASGHRLTSDRDIPLRCIGKGRWHLTGTPGSYSVSTDDGIRNLTTIRNIPMNGDYNPKSKTCGGIPLVHGHCIVHRNGTYTKRDTPIPTCQHQPPLPLCKSIHQAIEGAEFRKSCASNPKSALFPRNCSLLPFSQPLLSLLLSEDEALRKARVMIIGDSHERNIFTGMMHGTRNYEFMAEGHPNAKIKAENTAYHYRLWVDDCGVVRDDFQILLAAEGVNVELEVIEAVKTCKTYKRCVIVTDFWSPFPFMQEPYFKLMPRINPNLMIIGTRGKAQITKSYTDSIIGALKSDKFTALRSLLWVRWPYGRSPSDKEQRAHALLHRIDELRDDHRVRVHFISESSLNELAKKYGENDKQLTYTWHSMCTIGDNYPMPKWSITAHEPCTGLIDKTYSRIAFTLLAGDVAAVKAHGADIDDA